MPAHDPFAGLVFRGEIIAVIAAVLVLAALYFYCNANRRPLSGNLALFVILGAALVTPFAVIGAQTAELALLGAPGAPVIQALRRALQTDDMAYRDELTALKVADLVDPAHLAGGQKPADANAALARAHASDVRHQALIDGRVRDAQARLTTMPMGARQRAVALDNLNVEFIDDDGDLPTLRRYEINYLTSLDYEVNFLAQAHGWTVKGGAVTFTNPDMNRTYQLLVHRRTDTQTYLGDFARYSEERVIGGLGAPSQRPIPPPANR